ncbi:site-specific integrase [Flavobacterium suncheonense]|uniref:Recombinase n=1 Tax=Flavobacterium suncheonense GH29-5 = DSM 17707 TaxID=1121899 RepID=A0A0A2MBH4_9FLAO|nr:site-specific integrase [Flavobacterium suncheonense]KGO89001.1 recombinase [Flavobacterium suncheonense GH29-5 = DSM 17707]
MKNKISILFYAKSVKETKNGLIPIYLRITIDGKRIELSTSKFIEKSKWNSQSGKIKGNSEEARTINSYLDILRNKVYETEKNMINNNIDINSQTFKNKFLGIEERSHKLIILFEEHNKRMKELIGFEYSNNTYKKYETSLSHTKEFLQYQYNVSDIPLKNIDLAFLNDFDFYLRKVKKCNNNSTIKYIRNFGKIVKQAYTNGWIEKDPFVKYRGKVKEKERDFLTEQEIEDIMTKSFVTDRLTLVRDIFIFSCFTGLAYIDVKQLTNHNLTIGIDGDKWLFKNRQKTDTTSKIPLLPTAQAILDKYKNHPTCKNEGCLLPILSNQKMNAYLKEIADVCGIKKDLTFHIARHTFATTVTLSNGVPLETVSKMLGHTNLKTTQHYAKILDNKISNDMAILKQKFAVSNIKSSQSKKTS